MPTRWNRIIPAVILIALTLVIFSQLAFTDQILARGDTYVYFYPYWDARNEAMRAGELPLWTPDIYMGAPLLANPQIGTFYPLNWLTIPFNAPDAIRISILIHVALAAIGMYFLYTRVVADRILPALLASMLFALGGYTGAHVEQINQLQGLAWIPWLFWAYDRLIRDHPAPLFRRVGLVAVLFALQLFTGHTQTVFMSGFGLGIYAITHSLIRRDAIQPMTRRIVLSLLLLGGAAISGVLLAIPQLLPTMELIGMSNRGGGFTAQQATAFSLPPTYIGRGLLPAYDGQLFGEYIAYLGVIGLGLALLGAVIVARRSGHIGRVWLVIAVIGVFFAFGRFNPLYALLAELPGFNLFRVPARWLSLYTIGLAILAGIGLQSMLDGVRLSLRMIGAVCGALAGLMLLTRFVFIVDQLDIVGPAVPTDRTLLAWGLGLIVLLMMMVGTRRGWLKQRWAGVIVIVCVAAELFAASLIQPFNDLTPPDVYNGHRFTVSQMLAFNETGNPPGRMLSISGLQFDPGDRAALEARYLRAGMDDQAIRHAFVATKRQEMIYPNLPLTWHIPSVDGFGGGILPTIYYTQFTSLMLPDGTPDNMRAIDGRLGERMALPECGGACIPDERWFALTDTRYLITDKVFDVWHEGVAYDTQFHTSLENAPVEFASLNSFFGDQVRVLYNGDNVPLPVDDDLIWSAVGEPEVVGDAYLQVFQIDESTDLKMIQIEGRSGSILAVTLVESLTGNFIQTTPIGWQRVLSSDVKIYAASGSRQRVRVLAAGQYLPDDWDGSEAALKLMAQSDFNPLEQVIVHDGQRSDTFNYGETGTAEVITYSPTRIEVDASTPDKAVLYVADAWYPGWKVMVNDEPSTLYRANTMFRAVELPAGDSEIIMTFEPDMWYVSLISGVVCWLLLIAGFFVFRARSPAAD